MMQKNYIYIYNNILYNNYIIVEYLNKFVDIIIYQYSSIY